MTPQTILKADIPWAKLIESDFQTIPCPLCGTFGYEAISSMLMNWIEFFLVKCKTCGLQWRNPIPDWQFLTDLYDEHYYDVARYAPALVDQVGIPDTSRADQEFRAEKARAGVESWIPRGIAPITAGVKSRLIEIGGGRGYLQIAAAEKGWETVGLEISPHGIKNAIERQLLVLPIPLEDFCGKYLPYERYFHVAALFDFLEHISDPRRVLRMIAHILKNEGHMILRIPITVGSPRWHLIDHIWHFTEDTITAILEREGFVIEEMEDSGIFRSEGTDTVKNIVIFAKKGGT